MALQFGLNRAHTQEVGHSTKSDYEDHFRTDKIMLVREKLLLILFDMIRKIRGKNKTIVMKKMSLLQLISKVVLMNYATI